MERIQVGDQVIVVRGDHKGQRGKVSRVLPEGRKVVIEGVNMVKRHMRPAQQRPGGILEIEAPIHTSNVMPLDPQTNKPTRVRHAVQDGKKQRLSKDGNTITSQRG